MTNRQFRFYVDAVRRRRHTEDQFKFMLAGGKEADFPDYESPEEGQPTNEEIEEMLSASVFVRRAPDPAES